MIQIKKTILTLVALLAVTTGAWALDPNAVTAAEINSDLYSGWSSLDERLLKASDLPGFQAVTENQAKSWTGVPSTGRVKLFYDFVADGNVKVVIFKNGVYDSSYEEEDLRCYDIYEDIKYNGDTKYFYTTGPAPSASSGPKVAWDNAKKTGTFTMPGGNVTLEPEYFPQATVADGGVTAADADARATTDDPLVKVDATKLTGAKKLMYFVSNSGTTAPAYDAEGWTDQLPTAEGITQQGIVYVWYYPVGTDEGVDGATATYSDGDICLQSITARIAADPTYAVTFAEGTDPNEWSASPNAAVKKGQTVTVTYSGQRKVMGVMAEKKAATKTLAEATAEDVGKIAGKDGNIYDTKAAAEAVATGNAVAMIAYVGTASDCAHGLAIALADESDTKNYGPAGTACSGKAAVTGGTWRLPSIKDWQYMFIGCGASGSYSANPSSMSYSGLASKLTTAQGDALQTVEYWSSTESSPGSTAWVVKFEGSNASFNYKPEFFAYRVRACLAF